MFLSKTKPTKNLLEYVHKKNGRNNQGRITVWHKERGHKKFYRHVSYMDKDSKNYAINMEYDPYRSSYIVRMYDSLRKRFFYILKPTSIKVFDSPEFFSDKKDNIQNGDISLLENFKVGDIVHRVQFQPFSKKHVSTCSGTSSQILRVGNTVKLRLPSGKVRNFSKNCLAASGSLDKLIKKNKKLEKAGQSRHLGIRPTVRGVAMNPVDHPHGGGEGKTSGGRPSVTPWARITKGQPTRKRWKRKININ